MIEWSGRDIQRWAALVAQTSASEVSYAYQRLFLLVSPALQDRSTQQRVAKEFSAAILAFQRSQKLSAEKLKHQVVKEEQLLAGKIDPDDQSLERDPL